MDNTNVKIAYINPNQLQPTRTKEDAALIEEAANNMQLINKNLNILIKEIAKAGLLEDGTVISRINVLKQVIYTTQDLLE